MEAHRAGTEFEPEVVYIGQSGNSPRYDDRRVAMTTKADLVFLLRFSNGCTTGRDTGHLGERCADGRKTGLRLRSGDGVRVMAIRTFDMGWIGPENFYWIMLIKITLRIMRTDLAQLRENIRGRNLTVVTD